MMKLSVAKLMRWVVIMIVLLSAGAPMATTATRESIEPDEPDIEPERNVQHILIKVRPGLDVPTGRLAYAAPIPLVRALTTQGVTTAQTLFRAAAGTPSAIGLERIYRLELAANADVNKAVAALSANPNIEWAEPDYIAQAVTIPDDPLYAEQWGLSKINAPDAWDIVTGTQTVVIAVVDSGIDLTHPDLQANLWTNPGEIAGNSIDDDNNGYVDDVRGWNFVNGTNNVYDGNGHGTQVAGVAAAVTNNTLNIAGVCWNCKIMPVRVMADSGVSNYSDIALGVEYAADKGAKVINLSLGGYSYSNALRDAIDYAVNEKNAVVVGGAGNDNISTPFYPAAYENVLAVAGTTNMDTKATFSDYGTWVDISAPAVEIATTYLGGDWGSANGTSLATPFVAGVAALIRSQRPDWSAALVRNQVLQTADNIDALNPTYAGQLGVGRVNAARATLDPHPILVLARTSVNGDPTSRPAPDETATLAVTLRNDWWDATGVTGTLTIADPYVTLGQATASYGDLASGATGMSSPVYSFTVAAGAGYNHPISFILSVSANDGTYTVTLPFTITTRSGDEPFCGTMAEDLLWTSDKRYIIECNVGIAPGYTLTIQPGTAIRFAGNYALNVGGTLVADGTAAQPILFTGHTGGTWQRIFFDDPSADVQATSDGVYQSGNLLRHVRIEGATQGIGCTNATPFLEHVILTGGGMNCAAGDTALWVQDSDLGGDVQVGEGNGVDSVMGTWAVRTLMPTARELLAVAAAPNGKLYAIGGYNDINGILATVEAYDPATDSWTAYTPMPTARYMLAAAAALNGKLYAIGGEGGVATVEEYDPATDSWTTRTPMPTPRYGLAVVMAPNGKLYAIGGAGPLTTVEEYDPATDSWATRAPMPTARGWLAVASAPNGKLYAMGGQGNNYGTLATVEEYDPAADSWTTRTPMPTPRYGLAVVMAPNGKLYAIGGGDGPLTTVEEYDPATDSWTTRAPMPTARRYLAAAAASNGKLYAMGGLDNNYDYLATLEEYDPPTEDYGYHILRSILHGGLGLPASSQVLTSTVRESISAGNNSLVQNTTASDINLSSGVAANSAVTGGGISVGSGSASSNTVTGGGINAGNGVIVRNNSIENAPGWGIQASGNATVEYNRVVGCANGIQTSGGIVKGNLIANIAGTGLEIGSAMVEHNTFTGIGGSAVEIAAGTAVTLTRNNFEFNIGTYDVEDLVPKTTLMTVDARNNWWGTTNGTAIRQRIWDFNDDYNLGTVLYIPTLTAPDTTAPAYVRAITLTPESPVGIQTVTFDVLFSREMDVEIPPQVAFVSPLAWATRASMPTARERLSAAAAPNGKLYAIGGYGGEAMVEEYDPATDTWTARAPIPTARIGLAVVTASNGKLYAIGGYNDSGILATVEEYDPVADTWATRTPMPTARYDLGVAAAPNGKIYAIGGVGGDLTTVEEYDPATDSWTTRTSMSTPRYRLAVVMASQGKLYALGGDAGLQILATVEEYDPVTDSWITRAPMPTARDYLAAATAPNGRLYAIGGHTYESSLPLTTVEGYDPTTDTWTASAPMPTARRALAAAVSLNGKIYAIGGWDGSTLATVEELTPWAVYTDFYGGSWLTPNLYRTSYDFSTFIPRGAYTLTVSGTQTPEYTGSGTGILPVPGGGMEIAPNSAYTFTVDYAGYINDTTAPPVPTVTTCAPATPDALSATWSAYDPDSAIDRYQYAIGVTPGGIEVVNWTFTPLTETTRVSLTLVAGQTYYFSVKARNEAGLWSEVGGAGVVAGSDTCVSTEPAPEVDFNATPRSGTVPLTVQFTSTVTHAVTSYAWNFGDGSVASTANPTHTYSSAGSFGVTLIVTGPGGTVQAIKSDYITVSEPTPQVDFTGTPRSGDAPLTVQFTSTVTNTVTSYAWAFGDGGVATTANPTHTYTNAGSFGVMLIVTGPGGTAQKTRPGYITVNPPPSVPTATFSADVVSGLAPLTVTFTATTSGLVEGWLWTFGDGETATTGPVVQHTYQTPGVFDVSLTVSNTSGSYVTSEPDYIAVSEPTPQVDFIGTPRSGDMPLTVQFTSTVTNTVTSYAWNFGDGGIATTANPTHTYTNAGSFGVTLIVTGPGGTAQKTRPGYITVNPPLSVPTATFSADVVSGTVPLTVTFTAVTSDTVEGWLWAFGDGGTATTGPVVQHTYTMLGSFDVSLTVSNTSGSYITSEPDYITVSELPIPAPEVDFVGMPRSGTVPLTVQFTSTVTGTVTDYAWAFGDGGTANTSNPTYTYTSASSFGVSLVVTGPGGMAQVAKPAYITVTKPPIPAPEVDFTGTPRGGDAPLDVHFTSVVTGEVTSYAWAFGDGGIASTANPTHSYTSAGSFSVSLVVTGPGGTAQAIKPGYITVNPPPGAPTAMFSADVVSGTVPLAVTFTAVTSGTVEGWHWTFGDSTVAFTGPIVQHTYQIPGVFDVSLTISNTHGSYTVNKPRYITVSAGGHRVYLPLVLRN